MIGQLRDMRPVWPILLGASVMLSLAMGIRQSLGILAPTLTKDIAISMADFTLAIAVLNLAWGLLQAVAGGLVVRWGYRPILMVGAVLYVIGLIFIATAQGLIGLIIGAGLCVGASMACTGMAMAMAISSRAAPPAIRSTVLGIVSAVGSLGAMFAAPLGQLLLQDYGWRAGAAGFVVLSLVMLPSAWFASRIDSVPLPKPKDSDIGNVPVSEVLSKAFQHAPFIVLTCAYFICGMQLVFLLTHLPSYLALCGLDPMLSAQALGLIGAFNIAGSLFFGWAGGRWNKLVVLGMLYIARSIVIGWYFVTPATPQSTLLFAGLMGFLWLGVSPLIAGSIGEMFGLRWQPMIQGVAFVSHQLGSCLGAFGGGLVYTMLGSYTLAWQVGVSLGITGGLIQIAFALMFPPRPPVAVPA